MPSRKRPRNPSNRSAFDPHFSNDNQKDGIKNDAATTTNNNNNKKKKKKKNHNQQQHTNRLPNHATCDRMHLQPSSLSSLQPPPGMILTDDSNNNNNSTNGEVKTFALTTRSVYQLESISLADKGDPSICIGSKQGATMTTMILEKNCMEKSNPAVEMDHHHHLSDMSQSASLSGNETDDDDGGQFEDADNDPGECLVVVEVVGTRKGDPSRCNSNDTGKSRNHHVQTYDEKLTNGSMIQTTTTNNNLIDTTSKKSMEQVEEDAQMHFFPQSEIKPLEERSNVLPYAGDRMATKGGDISLGATISAVSGTCRTVDNQERKTEFQTSKSNEDVGDKALDANTRNLDILKKKAKTKLRKAMLAKKRALEEQRARVASARLQSVEYLRPINALLKGGLDSLVITAITDSDGSQEKVRFMSTPMLMEEEDGALDAVDKIGENGTRNIESRQRTNKTLEEFVSLMKRRRELQQIMIEAREKKERLEAAQKPQVSSDHSACVSNIMENLVERDEDGNTLFPDGLDISKSNESKDIPCQKPVTREELLKRKQDLQYTYYKSLLVQQERKLSNHQRESEATAAKINEYSQELHQIEDRLHETEQRIQTLNFRKRAVDDLIKKQLAELVKKRNLQHAFYQRDKSKS
jgi:hypothetical protein